MTEEELTAVRADLDRPADKDYDVRCENGSCAKDARLAAHTEELLAEVLRLRAWFKWLSLHSPQQFALLHPLDGHEAPTI